jgi:hypothetical protein
MDWRVESGCCVCQSVSKHSCSGPSTPVCSVPQDLCADATMKVIPPGARMQREEQSTTGHKSRCKQIASVGRQMYAPKGSDFISLACTASACEAREAIHNGSQVTMQANRKCRETMPKRRRFHLACVCSECVCSECVCSERGIHRFTSTCSGVTVFIHEVREKKRKKKHDVCRWRVKGGPRYDQWPC